MENNIPDNFKTTILDFISDLSNTFPEYSSKWDHLKNASDEKYYELFNYCKTVYPERFFDILYQNTDLFLESSDNNTFFLPDVDFKLLYNCDGVSENTKKTIWKYLQLILFISAGSIHDKSFFGETANIFDGIDESDLQDKLKSTMEDIGDFFKNINLDEQTNAFKNAFDASGTYDISGNDSENNDRNIGGLPNMDEFQDHLKSLFDGKIGKLAKELADEISGDFENVVGDMFEGVNKDDMDTKDVLKSMMKNPSQMIKLVKNVGSKIQGKIDSGEISKDELMGEASELLSKMKDMGGVDQFNDVLKKFAGNMGGKGSRIDKNALNRMAKNEKMRERLRKKMAEKESSSALSSNSYSIENDGSKKVFRINNEEGQERSSAPPVTNDDELLDWIGGNDITPKKSTGGGGKKKKKGKK